MAKKCPACGNKFSMRTAICDDWKDPGKSFGCPHCETFFIKDMNPNKRQNLISLLFAVGMVIPAVNIVFRYFLHGGDTYILFNAACILGSAILIAVLAVSQMFRPLVKSPYVRVVTMDVS